MLSVSRIWDAEGLDLDIIHVDDLVVQTHDTQGHLTQDGFLPWDREMLLLIVNFKAIAESQISSVASSLLLVMFFDLLSSEWRWGEGWSDGIEGHAIELELIILGSES